MSYHPQQRAAAAGVDRTGLKEGFRVKLESSRGMVETLVVDRIERPSEN